MRIKSAKKAAFGLWGDCPSMPRKISNLLKPFGLRLKVKSNRKWGDQVEVSIEDDKILRRRGQRHGRAKRAGPSLTPETIHRGIT